MFSRASKLRFRRSVRVKQRQVASIGEEAEQHFDQHFFRRLDRLIPVRRFVTAWLLLAALLITGVAAQTFALTGYYQRLLPAAGGVFTEGVVGEFTNANPIFATSAADRTVAKLVFSGLLTYNKQNKLVPNLAESWQSDARGQVYTFKLKKNVQWHDGQPFTAKDVAFTYHMIQNADAQSPLRGSWRDVKVEAVDDYTVRFTLANPLASFIYGVTNGIVPEHILHDVQPADMRTAVFNTANPVGTGPFKWEAIEVSEPKSGSREVRIALLKNDKYHRGVAQIDGCNVRVFTDQDQLIAAFQKRELHGVSGLIKAPKELLESTTEINFTQTAAMTAFFKTTEGVTQDKTVRRALVSAIDTAKTRSILGYQALAVDSPLLRGQAGYDSSTTQLPFNPEAAQKELDSAGWAVGKDGVRVKNGSRLSFTLVAERNKETVQVTKSLRDQWKVIGVDAKVSLQDASEFQASLAQHNYGVLLRGISIGVDPDVFVFWHSSQADPLTSTGLNFSEFASKDADRSLASARIRLDPALRAEKYKPFLQAWREDAPALTLYQPRSLYIVRNTVSGIAPHEVNNATDRFANVTEWMVRRAKSAVD